MKLLLCLSFLTSYALAETKKQVRWPAEASSGVARNIVFCEFAKNNLEISSVEVFASTKDTKGAEIILTNVSAVISVTAHQAFKMLTTGGVLTVKSATKTTPLDISGQLALPSGAALFTYASNSGSIEINGTKIKASSCQYFLNQ